LNIDELTLRLLVIVTPGLVCYFISRQLIASAGQSGLEVVLRIFLYAFLSYLLVGIASLLIPGMKSLDPIALFLDRQARVDTKLLGYGTLAGVALTYILSYAWKFAWANRLGILIGATRRYGEEDVWEQFLSSPDSKVNSGWLFVRDHTADLLYYFYVAKYSESRQTRELLLQDVAVYTAQEGMHLYDTSFVYLQRELGQITLEIPLKGGVSSSESQENQLNV